MPVSTSTKKTCPNACPFKGNGCYAESGPVNIHWNKISNGERGTSFDDFCEAISKLPKGQLWRHNQAGDLVGHNDMIHMPSLVKLVEANKGRRGFTYTHYPMTADDVSVQVDSEQKNAIALHNRAAIKYANENGFTINVSANSPEHAERLKKICDGPVVCVAPESFETDSRAVVCPAINREDTSCVTCGLCQNVKRGKTVAFPVHGTRKKAAEKIVNK